MIRILLAVPLLLVSCALPPPTPRETIKIASLLPRTGSAKQQTDCIVNAITLALERCGYEAGSFRLELVDSDHSEASGSGSWNSAIKKVESTIDALAKDPDVMVVIGPYNSGVARTALPVFNRAGLLLISPACTWPGLTKPGLADPGEPGIYKPTGKISFARLALADDVQASAAATWARKNFVKTVYILDDGEIWGKGLAGTFQEACRKAGIRVLGRESIDPKVEDFKSLMARIKPLDPDLVYFGGTTQTRAGEIGRDMVAANLSGRFMVSDGCFEDAFILAAGAESLEGRCFMTSALIPGDREEGGHPTFTIPYRRKYGHLPSEHGIYAYEAALVALESIRRAGKKDRDAIRAACLSIKNFDGALGTWSFDENGDTTLRTVAVYKVRNGKFEFVECVSD
ncbi:MAG TPA: branched-chain amino acid ABC transporter substrate-binding protein [Planctomycetota bacterium]|nr:branched-chain amino acid ABC transporter substrate-binding protein [Planctomycetota bacterium]